MFSAAVLDGAPWKTPRARHVCEYYERSPEEDEQYDSLYDAIQAAEDQFDNGSEAREYARNGHAAAFRWWVLEEAKEILQDNGDDRYEQVKKSKGIAEDGATEEKGKEDENEEIESWTIDKARRMARKFAALGLKLKRQIVDEVLTPLRDEHKLQKKLRKLNDKMDELEVSMEKSHRMKQAAEKESRS